MTRTLLLCALTAGLCLPAVLAPAYSAKCPPRRAFAGATYYWTDAQYYQPVARVRPACPECPRYGQSESTMKPRTPTMKSRRLYVESD